MKVRRIVKRDRLKVRIDLENQGSVSLHESILYLAMMLVILMTVTF